MTDSGPTWLLMIRDVSQTIHVADQPHLMASMILDAQTGLVRGVSMAPTIAQACAEAVDSALTRPAGPLPPAPPSRVVHHEDAAGVVADVLAEARLSTPPTMVGVTGSFGDAEDVFDSLIGHLSGRSQPHDPATGSDWRHLYAEASRYCQAEPWQRWSDTEPLDLEVRTSDSTIRYVAVVLGQAGIQRGLALYPGTAMPDALLDPEAPDGPTAPPGSLLLWLDAGREVPEDFAAKAARHGWPEDQPLVPLPLTVTDDGPADLDRVGTQHLAVALASIVDLHERGGRRATGRLRLAEDTIGSYAIGPAVPGVV